MQAKIFIDSVPVYRLTAGGVEIVASSGGCEFAIQLSWEHFFAGHAGAISLLQEKERADAETLVRLEAGGNH